MSIYCFDLDGTLCNWNKTPDFPKGRAEDCTPLQERIDIVNKLYEQGHTILIDTARGSNTDKLFHEMTTKQLEEWGVKYHELRTGVKLFAHYYIDDRGISDKDFFKI